MPADAPTLDQTEILLIRHAPALTEGRMAGRRDVAADCSDAFAFAALRGAVGASDHCRISPARRCVQTAAALWPDVAPTPDARLWEQDFGAWEGVPFADLPDLGLLSTAELAAHRPPQGESFLDVYARVMPVLQEVRALGGRVAIVAHAGVIRAALGLALGAAESGLAFQVAPLSLTTIVALPGGAFSIAGVNRMRR
ncbi:MAG: histidine phosphatase family protein [Cypionkella sp.]|uniref:histidine phosphatase family protein n=1 Tax=Cypionkella sp. TaxID=2811411 RepID=UPI002AB9FA38|nr:histidine phosphatase family protein [Cypionkella sp.]MDZ4311117.1 histidine phosphatase family protein [Cypionkella sp.]